MIENLIKEHINKLTISDIKVFAKDNNIYLNDEEASNIYDIVKKLPNDFINIEEVMDSKIYIYTNNSSFNLKPPWSAPIAIMLFLLF